MTTTHREGWQVGMTVFVVEDNHRRLIKTEEAVITKIGKKWVYFQKPYGREDRFDAETRYIDGKAYGSPGKVYATLAEYEDQLDRTLLWGQLRQKIGTQPPAKLSADRIRQLIEELA